MICQFIKKNHEDDIIVSIYLFDLKSILSAGGRDLSYLMCKFTHNGGIKINEHHFILHIGALCEIPDRTEASFSAISF